MGEGLNITTQTNSLVCIASMNNDEETASFASAMPKSFTLSQSIEQDKRYGKMTPANLKYFTYAVLNEDREYSEEQVHKAVRTAYKRWELYADLPKLKKVNKDYEGVIDFRIEFRTVSTDPEKKLKKNTIMYHYYPINDHNNPLRGLCVVNKDFFFTSNGMIRSPEFFNKHGVRVTSDYKLKTIDFDQVYSHELGHGLGLPHDTEDDEIMSYRYDLMREYPNVRDQSRIKAKYGNRNMLVRHLSRWLKWLRVASERNG